MTDRLAEIFAHKKKQIASMMAATPAPAMADMAKARQDNGRKFYSLHDALTAATAATTLPLIAEIKKASPSCGLIRADFSAINLAQDYMTAGVTAFSILTESQWFQGDYDDLRTIAKMTQRPILQKDFIFCEYQLHHAVAIGADAVLLILAALPDDQARDLEKTAHLLGLEVILETHDETEIARANAMASRLVGVNNRNLKTLTVSLTNGEQMLKKIDGTKLAIAESGLSTPADINTMWGSGARGFLIGEYFMKQPDVFTACHDLINQSNELLFK